MTRIRDGITKNCKRKEKNHDDLNVLERTRNRTLGLSFQPLWTTKTVSHASSRSFTILLHDGHRLFGLLSTVTRYADLHSRSRTLRSHHSGHFALHMDTLFVPFYLDTFSLNALVLTFVLMTLSSASHVLLLLPYTLAY